MFRKRCRTPPKQDRQAELNEFLAKQIEYNQKQTQLTKAEMAHLEKMEQLRLVEDLAAQREAYLKTKHQKQHDLKAALDTQIKNRPSPLPKALPDGEVFGMHDMKNDSLARMKAKEIDQHMYNRDAIEQKKREALLGQLKEQEMDAENNEKLREE